VNGGLWLLIRLQAWGKVRFFARRARTLRGALSTAAAAGFFILVIGHQFYALARSDAFPPADPAALRTWVPVSMLASLLLSAWVGRALAFTPQEIDFLFPAPLSRRELLAYHVVSRLGVRVLSGLWAAVFVQRLAPSPAAAVAAVVLGMVFLHLAIELTALATSALSAWSSPWVGRGAWAALAASIAWAAHNGIAAKPPGAEWGVALESFARSLPMRIATFPLRPFGELFAAQTGRAALLWTAAALGAIALQGILLMALDVAYTERSLATSRRRMERRMRSGEPSRLSRPWKLRVRVPRLATMGTGAPLARRQLLELLRTPRALLFPLLLAGFYVAMSVVLPLARGVPPDESFVWITVALAVFLPFFFPGLGFDFRHDLDRMAYLKGLPLTPFAVAVGQIFAPAALFAMLQWLVVASAASALPSASLGWLAVPALLGPALAWAMVATDNLTFLWMPYRHSTDGAQNVQFVGKSMLILLAKLVVLAVMGILAALGYWAAGQSWLAGALAAAVALALGCAALTWAVGASFAAFDVTLDVPG
jgi:hypothetical protein